MLIDYKQQIKLPAKTIIEDVLTRDGAPGISAFYPYEGMRSYIISQFSRHDKYFRLSDFIDYAINGSGLGDYNLSRATTEATEDYESEKSQASTVEEDIHTYGNSTLKRFIGFLIYGYRKNKNSPYINNANFVRSFVNEDNTFVPENELDLMESSDDIISISAASKLLPYYIKFIHQLSKIDKVQYLSFAFAYYDLKYNKKMSDESINRPVVFSSYDLYKMYPNGLLGKKFEHENDQKQEYYPKGRHAVTNTDNMYNSLQAKVLREFINICITLDIDLSQEDPTLYTEDNISRLVVDYIPSNDEYISIFGSADEELKDIFSTTIFQSLVMNKDTKSIDINEHSENNYVEFFRETLLDNVADIFNLLNLGNDNSGGYEVLCQYYKMINSNVTMDVINASFTNSDFIMSWKPTESNDYNDAPIIINDTKRVFSNIALKYFILSSGYVVYIPTSDTNKILYIDKESALNAIKEIQNGKRPDIEWSSINIDYE